MEINLNVDFKGKYLASVQSSTLTTINISRISAHAARCDSNGTDEYKAFWGTSQFVNGLIIYPILCVTGILGNSLSLIVLSHKDMATSTNIYLLGKVLVL